MSATSTVRARWASSTSNRRPVLRPSAHVRIRQQLARETAAALYLELFPRRTKVIGVSAQKLGEGRKTGGAIGDVKALMIGRPDHALRIATHLFAVARSLCVDADACMLAVLCDEQRADSDEDCAQADLLANPECIHAMREYLRASDASMAKQQHARDIVARRLAEAER